jgi:hypothetical protein
MNTTENLSNKSQEQVKLDANEMLLQSDGYIMFTIDRQSKMTKSIGDVSGLSKGETLALMNAMVSFLIEAGSALNRGR